MYTSNSIYINPDWHS